MTTIEEMTVQLDEMGSELSSERERAHRLDDTNTHLLMMNRRQSKAAEDVQEKLQSLRMMDGELKAQLITAEKELSDANLEVAKQREFKAANAKVAHERWQKIGELEEEIRQHKTEKPTSLSWREMYQGESKETSRLSDLLLERTRELVEFQDANECMQRSLDAYKRTTSTRAKALAERDKEIRRLRTTLYSILNSALGAVDGEE